MLSAPIRNNSKAIYVVKLVPIASVAGYQKQQKPALCGLFSKSGVMGDFFVSVDIRVKGDRGTTEYQDARALKKIFEMGLSKSAKGEILIISNATLFGQKTQDVDLVVIGKLENYKIKVKSKARTYCDEEKNYIDLEEEFREVYINDFCFAIESKSHSADSVQLDGITLKVKHKGKYHDATNQSQNQRYALVNFLEDRLGFSPQICNFIWLTNVSADSIKALVGNTPNASDKHNYLPSNFGLIWLFQLACVQKAPINYKYSNSDKLKPYSSFNCLQKKRRFDFGEIEKVFNLFEEVKQGMGDLTRKKIEYITRITLKDQVYAQAIGKKLVVISGRAGTGKTIRLLNIACDLAVNNRERCLILTFNHALVGDIKRMLALAGIPDGIDDYSVNISTLHSFFYQILCGFEVGTTEMPNGNVYIEGYLKGDNYEKLLQELYEYVDHELIGEAELQSLMRSRHQQIAWDYVFVDEAQDWKEIERDLIYFIFGKERVIIADGIDQLIRSQRNCNWTHGLSRNIDFHNTHVKMGLRQKRALVDFVNQVAGRLGVSWSSEPKDDLYGGKIIIKIGDYTKDLHDSEFKLCRQYGNSAYEMMFLVPPSLVNRSGKQSAFSKTNKFTEKGIQIWDGTDKDRRSEYSVDLDRHRLLQYESCRGLEGWTVVCLELDEFIRCKIETFEEEEEIGQLALDTFEEKRERFVNLWTLIPLTRAIDTLVITIKNPESEIAQILKEIHLRNPDNIEWIE